MADQIGPFPGVSRSLAYIPEALSIAPLLEKEGVQARLEEVSDVEEQARRLREIPRLVEEYLTDLPYLIDRMPVIREYETVLPERAEDGSLPIYTEAGPVPGDLYGAGAHRSLLRG